MKTAEELKKEWVLSLENTPVGVIQEIQTDARAELLERIKRLENELRCYIRDDGHDFGCSYDIDGNSPETDYCDCGRSIARLLSTPPRRKDDMTPPNTDTPKESGWPPKDTPRTDKSAIEINRPNPNNCDQLDWSSFARTLERELAAMTEQVEVLQAECARNNEAAQTWDRLSLETQLAAMTKERDGLREQLAAANKTIAFLRAEAEHNERVKQ
jgi:hypothetical protein